MKLLQADDALKSDVYAELLDELFLALAIDVLIEIAGVSIKKAISIAA